MGGNTLNRAANGHRAASNGGVRNADEPETQQLSTSPNASVRLAFTGRSCADRRVAHRLDVDNTRSSEREWRYLPVEPADVGFLHFDVHLHGPERRRTRMVVQRLGLVIGQTRRPLRDPEFDLVCQPFVLRGCRLLRRGDDVQRDNLVGSETRRLLGFTEFGFLRDELVLCGRQLRGSSGYVRRDNLVGSEAHRPLGLTRFGFLRDELVLCGRRLRGSSGHVQRDNLVSSAVDGPVRPLLLFRLVLVEHLLCRRQRRGRRDQLQRVGVVPVDRY